jgi:hypothetical protein
LGLALVRPASQENGSPEYRSSGYAVPFQRLRYPQAEQAAKPRQCWVSAFAENQANPSLILY